MSGSVCVLFTPDGLSYKNGGVLRYFNRLHREFESLHQKSTLMKVRTFEGGQSVLGRTGRRAVPLIQAAAMRLPGPWLWHLTWFPRPVTRGRAPLAITIYDLIHLEHEPNGEASKVLSERQRRWARIADVVFCISEATAAGVIERFSIPTEKICVTPLGVDMPEEVMDNGQRDWNTILYVGRRGSYKNWQLLPRAVAQLEGKGLQVVCVGGGPLSADEGRLLDDLRVAPAFSFVGATDEELVNYYRKAGAVVCTSVTEGFGLPVLEGLAYGTPAICGTGGGLPEAAGPGAHYLAEMTPEALAQGIATVLNNNHTWRRLSEAGRLHAEQHTWRRTALRTLEGYGSLIGNNA